MVENGSLYLFRIYNKDFSLHSKGKKNLHTLYFQMLFDSRNLSNPVYKLSGGGEIFYRPASLTEPEEITVHPANQPIGRKQSKDGQTSLFPYDNDAFIIYPYVTSRSQPSTILIHAAGDVEALEMPVRKHPVTGKPFRIEPLYRENGETVFKVRAMPGKYELYRCVNP